MPSLGNFLPVLLPILFLIATFDELLKLLGPELAGCNVGWVLPQGLSAHGAIEGLDGLEAEPRPDFNQHQLLYVVFSCELFLMLVDDLIVPEPNTVIVPSEGDHMIDEGL